MLDCEQSLFFSRFQSGKGSACACNRWAAREPQDARNEGGSRVICVSRVFCSMDQEKIDTARSLRKCKINGETLNLMFLCIGKIFLALPLKNGLCCPCHGRRSDCFCSVPLLQLLSTCFFWQIGGISDYQEKSIFRTPITSHGHPSPKQTIRQTSGKKLAGSLEVKTPW